MKRINLLLPFTHGVDMRAIEQALLLAKGRQATLVPLALIHVPEERRAKGARIEHVQQSKDFLEAVKHKAARYAVPIERFEVFTSDVVQSINTIASDLECEGILLFVGRNDGMLLQASEIKHLMETTTGRLYILRLRTGDGEGVAQKLLKGFSRWLSLSGINWRPNLRTNLDSSRSRRPESVRPSWRPCRIPGGYRLRFRPREHSDWNVPPLDQR